MEKVTLPSGKALRLYDTLIRKKDRKWFRVTGLTETEVTIKTAMTADEQQPQSRKEKEVVTIDCLEADYTLAGLPPVTCYVDESLIEKPSPEKAEREKRGAKEAYAARKLGVERARRKHRK